MYVAVQKLKTMKVALKNLNKEGFTDVQADDGKAYQEMITAQEEMHRHPGQVEYADAQLDATKLYHLKHQIYTEYLRQMAKLDQVKNGDEHTTLFHQSIKARKV